MTNQEEWSEGWMNAYPLCCDSEKREMEGTECTSDIIPSDLSRTKTLLHQERAFFVYFHLASSKLER